jgi:CHASE2 domain
MSWRPYWKYWRWIFLAPLLVVAGVFFVTIFDPVEWESVTRKWSANIVYKVYAALYPETFRDKVTVVFLDSNTLFRRGEAWPPSHKIHSDLLTALLDYQPAAILVDLFFTEQRADDHFNLTDDALRDNARRKNGMVPIYFIADCGNDQRERPARPEVLKLADDGTLTLVSADINLESGVSTLYPLEARRCGSREIEPAALAIATARCGMADIQTCEALRSLQTSSGDPRPLEVVWGLAPELCKNDAMDRDLTPNPDDFQRICSDLFSHWYSRPIQLLWEDFIIPKWRRIYDPVPVPYHAYFSAEQVLDGNMHNRLKPYLSGKIVIYSARYRLVEDHALSPVHGADIAGAFAQAMAIDNLLTFGDRYMHPTSMEGTFIKTATDFQPTGLMLLAAIAVGLYRWSLLRSLPVEIQNRLTTEAQRELLHKDELFLRRVRIFLYLAVIVIAALEFSVMHISPLNWLAMLLVIEGTHWFERKAFAIKASQ